MAAITPPISKQKTALVVDDSKLARYVLKEMLLELGLQVETAESAEEALGSLSAFRPDVIFMDHMMPGMDGFQAVQAIKNDPKTAMIPILMYTSKDGGVYVSQARALGAVGVLPKKLKPVQLEKVLMQLRLVPFQEPKKPQEKPASEPPVLRPSAKIHSIIGSNGTSKKEQKSSLEELARSASEEQENDSMRQLFRQLFVEQRDSIKQDQWKLVEALVAQVTPIVLASRNKIATWQVMVLSGIFIFLIAIMVLLYGLLEIGDAQQKNLHDQLIEQQNTLNDLQGSLKSAQINQESISENRNKVLNIKPLEWAINQNSQLPAVNALSSLKTHQYMAQLTNQLGDFGFAGTLYIQFHSGLFCQQKTKTGSLILAQGSNGISQCLFSAYEVNNPTRISEFEDYLVSLDQEFSNIHIAFEFMGTQYTLEDYPSETADINVSQWNKIASKNNRFNFVLVSDS